MQDDVVRMNESVESCSYAPIPRDFDLGNEMAF
jgi:hypothetical protein